MAAGRVVNATTLPVKSDAVAAVEAKLDYIQRILKIEAVSVVAGDMENALVRVEAVIVPPTAE